MPRLLAVLGSIAALLSAPALYAQSTAQSTLGLAVHPSSLQLHGGQTTHRLLVSVRDSAGNLADSAAQAKFRSSNAAVVSVSADGECTAVGEGEAAILVQVGSSMVSVPVTVLLDDRREPPSFVNDVIPILTRLGCNQGACHGKQAGQNGFRLSLRGYAPELDHQWLTREFPARRISTTVPDVSLLLKKPLGQARHEGGKLMNAGSRFHHVLHDWIAAGAPESAAHDVALRHIEVLPGNRTLPPGQRQSLLVQAAYSDGSRRDVTWLTKFESNDPGMASVSDAGVVQVLRPGETAIRASFQGQVAVVIFTAPADRKVDSALLSQRHNFVDEYVFNKLAALRIEPSGLCSDAEFLRRAFLDTIGVLPTSAEARAFLADQRLDRRARLIDALLERPEFVDYWALYLGDLLQNRKERDHDVRGAKGVRAFHDWLRQQVAANRPWDELARAVLTARGKSSDNPAVGYFIVTVGEREAHQSEAIASVAQAFLGTRIGCAQCHNHPLEKYTQDDYYHFAGFFAKIRLQRRDPKEGPTTLLVGGPDGRPSTGPEGVTQPRTGVFLRPRPLDRSSMKIASEDDPREKLVAWMTDPANEYFSGAMVNRLWKHFLGVGLVEPVDDLRASNPPSNPELWKALNQEFTKQKFDLRHLMRIILNSRTYQLSSATRPGNVADTRFYSHYYARRLPAEVLLDALSSATGVPDEFPGYPLGIRAGQLPDPTLKSYFLSVFGRSERVTACACERNGEVTMPQVLHMQNGETVVHKIQAADSRLGKLLQTGKSDDEIIEELSLSALSRPASEAVKTAVRKSLGEGASREEVLRDFFWALLNSKEFAFNH